MAEIKPIRAWRYNEGLTSNIDQLICPLFDVVSQEQLDLLYSNELNSIHLSVPKSEDYDSGVKMILDNWKKSGVLSRDPLAGIYVYYQYFTLPGENFERCRKGIICNVRVYDWAEKVILRHENTMPRSVIDRQRVLEATKLNVSPTHGLYSDGSNLIEKYLDESIKNPIYETQDYQGVKDVLSVIHDQKVIAEILGVLKDKQIILADGHHRYEGALAHKQSEIKKGIQPTGDEPYNYHMMYLTNTENANVRILPTHRLVTDYKGFSEGWFMQEISKYFHVNTLDNPNDVNEVLPTEKWTFGLLIGENGYRIQLKNEMITQIYWHFPDVIIEIDLTVLHFFIFEKILKIKRDGQRVTEILSFERSLANCHRSVRGGSAQAAFITRDISMETVKEVCYSGYTMPQKSTYFYPKVICGYLFSSIDEKEYDEEIDSCF